jgi:hypothetical protein
VVLAGRNFALVATSTAAFGSSPLKKVAALRAARDHSALGQERTFRRVRIMSALPPESGHPRTDEATVLLSCDDHCPIGSAAILRVCNANPLRAVQQQVGAMSSRIDPLL